MFQWGFALQFCCCMDISRMFQQKFSLDYLNIALFLTIYLKEVAKIINKIYQQNLSTKALSLIFAELGKQKSCEGMNWTRNWWFYNFAIMTLIDPDSYKNIATLSSILDSQSSWESCKFYLARWSHGVALFLEDPGHPPTQPPSHPTNSQCLKLCAVSPP